MLSYHVYVKDVRGVYPLTATVVIISIIPSVFVSVIAPVSVVISIVSVAIPACSTVVIIPVPISYPAQTGNTQNVASQKVLPSWTKPDKGLLMFTGHIYSPATATTTTTTIAPVITPIIAPPSSSVAPDWCQILSEPLDYADLQNLS